MIHIMDTLYKSITRKAAERKPLLRLHDTQDRAMFHSMRARPRLLCIDQKLRELDGKAGS